MSEKLTLRLQELKKADALAKSGEVDAAWAIVNKYLCVNPDDPMALILGCYCMDKAQNYPVAYHFARKASEMAPDQFATWFDYGRICDHLWRPDESERAYRKAIKVATNPRNKSYALMNLAALYIQSGEFSKAEPFARQALMADPDLRGAKANLGFCQLAARNWAEGWDNYANSLGAETRKMVQYGDEPIWDGRPCLTVAVYGEQGLGDEISFASMIPDAVNDCARVIIDCDKRLKGLFQRSFPLAKVYGTRAERQLAWDVPDQSIHASIPMGGLGGIYRRSAEAFTGKPYLTPDPDRAAMWSALFAGKGKPVIGIAWTGGIKQTGADFRKWSLEDLLPIFQSVDAHFVSLQYRDASAEIAEFTAKYPEIDLAQYPYGTLTADYDDVAAMVFAMDRVVSMQTAVVHLAGALGKSCDVFVPKNSQWRYSESGDSMPWYSSVRVIRQAVRGHWSNTIKDYADELSAQVGAKHNLRLASA